jgi:hypothetical protein
MSDGFKHQLVITVLSAHRDVIVIVQNFNSDVGGGREEAISGEYLDMRK